ncbi:MAG: adenine phosphoribosyltransferase [Bacteroidetes bacterium]|nr:adenine phosphoribosyltransferase [Bacteroidota bacterium]HET6245865.1 adenine phosphoribosyltransferase [Bacteroidia bacterium]
MITQKIKSVIRDIPDFPKPGILFKDITPILLDAELCTEIVNEFISKSGNSLPDAIIGVESRGFFFGMMLASKLNIPFIPVRKAGKLPYKTISHEYDLEYGSSKIEMHTGVIQKGWNVLIHDDLLATGGTAAAAAELVVKQHAKVSGFLFLVELDFLNGRKGLDKYAADNKIISLINY